MKTQEQVLKAVRDGLESQCLDRRDWMRMAEFFPVSDWYAFGLSLRDGEEAAAVKPWTREAFVDQMRGDVEFGFEKALNRRGLSAGMMHEVVLMWLWILDEDELLAMADDYAQYGLPLFKAVAIKFGFPNQIGNDSGREEKYSMEAE